MKTIVLAILAIALLVPTLEAQGFVVAPMYVPYDPSGPCGDQNLAHRWSLASFTEWYCNGSTGLWTRTVPAFPAFYSSAPGGSKCVHTSGVTGLLTEAAVDCSSAYTLPAATSSGLGGVTLAVAGQKFFGTTAPTNPTGNLPGDLFVDTTGHALYFCNAASGTAAPACTTVSATMWVKVPQYLGDLGWQNSQINTQGYSTDFVSLGSTGWWAFPTVYFGTYKATGMPASPLNVDGPETVYDHTSLGAELATSNSSCTGWSPITSTWTCSSGVLTHVTGNTTATAFTQTSTAGWILRVVLTVSGTFGGAADRLTVSVGGTPTAAIAANGTYSFDVATTTTGALTLTPTSTFTGSVTVTSLSLKQENACTVAAGVESCTSGFSAASTPGITKTCSAMPTAMTIVGGIITSVTGGTCTP